MIAPVAVGVIRLCGCGRQQRLTGALRRALLFVLTVLSTLAQSSAQSAAPPWTKVIWYTYNADHPAGDRWEIHLDTSYRPTIGSPARQWMVRPGANVRLNDRWKLSLAYGYFDTHPNGLADDEGESREHRMQQQIEYSLPWRRNVIRHRFRMEERWISSQHHAGTPDRWRWQDRPRYMLRLDRPLLRGSNGGSPVLTVYEEVLFSLASPNASAFEQNRVYGCLTWKVGKRLAMETGLMHQAVKSPAGPFRHNLIVMLALRNNIPLHQLFGWLPHR